MENSLRNKIIYVVLMICSSIYLAGAALFDQHFGANGIIDIVSKVAIIAIIFAFAFKQKEVNKLFKCKCSVTLLFVAIIPAIFNILSNLCKFNVNPSVSTIVITTLGILTTAIWEEMYYRYIGDKVIAKEKYSKGDIIFLACVFSLAHAINFFFYNPVSVVIQLVLAFTVGIFMLSLYKKSEGLTLPIISHFALNISSQVFRLFADNSELVFGNIAQDVIIILQLIVTLILGIIILKKSGYIKEK